MSSPNPGLSEFRNSQEFLAREAARMAEARTRLGLDGLVGDQTFTDPCPDTLIVTEYIHRYGGFTGYFTLSNVTALTRATGRQ